MLLFLTGFISYNGVMKAFSKSDVPGRGLHAMNLLQDIKSKASALQIQPNMITYSTCIYVLARSNETDRVEKAESIFHEMLTAYHESGKRDDLKPSPDSWSLLLLAYAFSETNNKAEKALSLVDRILAFGMTPNTVHYNTILLACALEAKKWEHHSTTIESNILRSSTRQVVYKVMSVFDQWGSNGLKPNYTTFINLINCSQLFEHDHERTTFIKDIFERCKQAGLVDEKMVDLLIMKDVLPSGEKESFVILPEWSKEVKKSNQKLERRDDRMSSKYYSESELHLVVS